jgi:hypothetical protein
MSYRYGDVVSPFLAVEEPLAVEDKHFVDCVRDGTRPMTDGANGLAVVKTLECAQISLREGRMVQLAELDEQPVAKLDRLPRTLDRLDVSRPLEASVPLSR